MLLKEVSITINDTEDDVNERFCVVAKTVCMIASILLMFGTLYYIFFGISLVSGEIHFYRSS